MKSIFCKISIVLSISSLILSSCKRFHNRSNVIEANQSILDTAQRYIVLAKDSNKTTQDTVSNTIISTDTLNKNKVLSSPEALVAYAITLEGSPYLYGSQDPEKGFDNSGFVNYVFQHFGIEVPRFSGEFSKVGEPIAISAAGPGDIILFSITDIKKISVGHVGIITSEVGEPVSFIHATSGKFKGVVITKMNSHYQKRLMGIRTLFR
nr:C40 family peptidase [Pseudopedobacter sp.]